MPSSASFITEAEVTAWADASAPELRANHWGVTFSGPRADEDPNPSLPSLPMVAVAVGWNVGVGDLAEADLFADLDRERLPPCIGRHCQIAARQFGLGRPERDSANDHRLSRRSGWLWGTSTKTIRTPSGSSIHISTSPQGSCCGPRTTGRAPSCRPALHPRHPLGPCSRHRATSAQPSPPLRPLPPAQAHEGGASITPNQTRSSINRPGLELNPACVRCRIRRAGACWDRRPAGRVGPRVPSVPPTPPGGRGR
jgi:hypothetical protein